MNAVETLIFILSFFLISLVLALKNHKDLDKLIKSYEEIALKKDEHIATLRTSLDFYEAINKLHKKKTSELMQKEPGNDALIKIANNLMDYKNSGCLSENDFIDNVNEIINEYFKED